MPNRYKDALKHTYKYWVDKPTMGLNKKLYASQSINNDRVRSQYNQNIKISLPNNCVWRITDLHDIDNMDMISKFLSKYYTADLSSKFRTKYDTHYVSWKLGKGGKFICIYYKHILVGTIGYNYKIVQVYEKTITMCEPMFLCAHPKFRGKGIAKALMDEVTRQSSISEHYSGIFVTNVLVPTPSVTLRHYIRPINYKKLVKYKFLELNDVDIDLGHEKSRIKLKPNKKYILAKKNTENVKIVHDMYSENMKTFNITNILSLQEIEHYFFDDRYTRTYFIYDKNDQPVDYVTYHFYDIIDTDGNEIKSSTIISYSSNQTRSDLIIINIMKQLSKDGIDVIYLTDMGNNCDVVLSDPRCIDYDSDSENLTQVCDLNFLKTGKKSFINLYNWQCERLKQNMVNWLFV